MRRARIRRAMPGLAETVVGSPAWAAAMALSSWFGVILRGYATPSSIGAVALTFAAGALLAWPVALWAYQLIARGRPGSQRFASAFLCLCIVTAGSTALVYALWYRDYYAEWHEATFSIGWFIQFAFTVAGAIFQFAVLGLRLFFPFGLVALFAASIWLSRAKLR